jgi:hypothetical protein
VKLPLKLNQHDFDKKLFNYDEKVEILHFKDNPGDVNLIEEMFEEFADLHL